MWQDIRLAFRVLAKNPGFSAVAIAALAVGIGANATVFSLVNGILFKNLAFADSDRVLYITSFNPKSPRGSGGISAPNFYDLRAQVKSFEGLGATGDTRHNLSDDIGVPDSYRGARITANGFRIIGQKPILGRDFLPEDEKPGADPVVILGYSIWENRYGKDASVIGRKIRLSSTPHTVIGVMPKGLAFPGEASLWQPLDLTGKEPRGDRFLSVFGKLSASTSRAAAQAEIATIAERLAAQYPNDNQDVRYRIQGFNEMTVRGKLRTVFLAMMGAVGFVLLIACANVANLMLARAVGRSREISIRAALGAGRWRVVRQLLTESLLLSAIAGVLALFIARWGVRAFDAAVIDTGKPAWIDFSLNYVAFAYLAGISFVTAILFGLVPALRLARLDVNSALKDGGRAGAGVRGKYLSGALVVAEMTLAVVLLTGAGLMMRSFLHAYNRPTGVDSSNVLTMSLELAESKYGKPEQRAQFERSLTQHLQAVPGVEAGAVNVRTHSGDFEIEGVQTDPKNRPGSDSVLAGEHYFDILRVRAVRGRLFTAADHAAGASVAVVNQAFANRYWPGEEPVGKRFRLIRDKTPKDWITVVGMVPDILQNTSRAEIDPVMFLPYRLDSRTWMSVLVRTQVPPSSVAQAVRLAIREVDADLPVRNVRTLDEEIAMQSWPLRVFGTMFGIFGGAALLLATVGLYAVVAYGVNQRTPEIGIRVALGASAGSILRMVFTTGMRQVAIGLVLGLGAAFGVTQVISSLLVGVSPTDPLTFGGVAALLMGAATLGCAIPARRAMRVDPAIALRHE